MPSYSGGRGRITLLLAEECTTSYGTDGAKGENPEVFIGGNQLLGFKRMCRLYCGKGRGIEGLHCSRRRKRGGEITLSA